MAGIAPLNGTTTTTPLGAAATVPGSITPAYAQPPQSAAPAAANQSFTAFPSSYAGFGTNGSGFGTLSVVNGALSIVDTPAGGLPPASAPAPPPGSTGKAAITPAPAVVTGATDTDATGLGPTSAAATAPAQAPAPLPNQASTNTTTGQQGGVPGTTTVSNAPGTVDDGAQAAATTGTTGTTGSQTSPAPPTASDDPTKTGSATGNNNSQSNPTAGLIGAQSPNAVPGSDPAPVNLAQGLLGSPPTNPIVIQADQQEANAAAAAAQAASAAADQKAAEQAEVQQLQARIAAARATGNPAAAAELQSKVTLLSGQIQGQIFAGIGSTPPQPFAAPAIPPVFLDIPS